MAFGDPIPGPKSDVYQFVSYRLASLDVSIVYVSCPLVFSTISTPALMRYIVMSNPIHTTDADATQLLDLVSLVIDKKV